MNKKSLIALSILLFTIGFAAVATNLIINGTTNVVFNDANFDVYFSKAVENDKKNNKLIKDDTHITFNYNMSLVGDKYILDYDVTNGSKEYDASVSINCTNSTEYLSITNDFNTVDNLLATETRTGTLTVELIKAYSRESTDIEISCEITGTAVERDKISEGEANNKIVHGENLYALVVSKNIGDTSLINFNTPADGSETGVYNIKGTDDKNVYFYRGNITDNNVIYANKCWRIVRTTETGGTKLIYNGVPTDGKCNNIGESSQIGRSAWNASQNDNAYVGYMYGTPGSDNYEETHENKNSSTIKVYIDDWYEKNIKDTEYEALLEDTVWCNDRSTVAGGDNNTYDSSYGTLGYGTNQTGYGVSARADYATKNVNPSLVCFQDNDKFTVSDKIGNGKLTYPVGLMTMDEYALAGYTSRKDIKGNNKSNYSVSNTNYLYTGQWFWSFSPVSVYSTYARVGVGDAALGGSGVASTGGVRPAIALNSSAEIIDGDGTDGNPYIVE